MNKITILVSGYAIIHDNKSWHATSTAILIHSNHQKIIVDPGCDRPALIIALNQHQLSPEDIDWVFITHRHLDHSALIGYFPRAKAIDSELYQDGSFGQMHQHLIPDTDLQILNTPGHSPHHASLLVPNTSHGNTIIAGDVFWWPKDQVQTIDLNAKDHFADGNHQDLIRSRRQILKQADYLIPGHGLPFKP